MIKVQSVNVNITVKSLSWKLCQNRSNNFLFNDRMKLIYKNVRISESKLLMISKMRLKKFKIFRNNFQYLLYIKP